MIWNRYVTSLEISPGFSSDLTIFAATEEAGVFKSTDGGLTWATITFTPILFNCAQYKDMRSCGLYSQCKWNRLVTPNACQNK